jgi:ketosteroid isomerase-like protein
MDRRPSLPDWHTPRPEASAPSRATVQRWLDAYVAAWRSYDEDAIADLWTEDAVWLYPFATRARGRSAITAEWLAEKHLFDGRGYDGHYEPIAIDGDVVVTHGRTLFFDAETGATQGEFDNIWVLRFGPDGRCAEFHEWYTGRPEHDPSRAMPTGD